MKLNEIVNKKELAPSVKLFDIYAPNIAKKCLPGNFIILMVSEYGERIPLTINDCDRAKGTIRIIVQEIGRTTQELGKMKVGEIIPNLMGPLGHASHIEKFGKVVCIGGGVGTAVMYPIAKALKEKGNEVITIIGAKTKELVILEEEMKKISSSVHITTDDGSYGKKGFVTDALNEILSAQKIDRVFAIGPLIMMKIISEITKQYSIPTIVSLNPIMIDGTGMCGGCRVSVGNETKFACVDGPEFDAHKVNFDELLHRNNRFAEEEQHSCKLQEK
ncbi:MAG: sulfide/dihydroorotate dehydrogenase-like FAD/NAD-binding protein [Candidatus Omnitrophica bacterium]|nr:sulfide/dihydroorotate dehydrogenase-like FAD/NAD-binding protein [Candidatus Omnitrophota bacterium]MBU1047091.1 sulfide/dihydroorotate dehydrogenase-like FAD/NAD-binding protein [Candidatus Omnitrophota bacterium]MBU1631543.1 sulfide/dihydroorotate dehydrogenase-like FAD/NAD-binding protein [Candidatus Omnitrophota bacterium]MBU1767721.1 sulfide/dihydroorotate dehydrogenase-like FAD/NAD-binding protein [Candidatus Omnitrophota bacterium]MBU1888757.1 sulfide/dihydroorotate dehydrogenase-lik